MQEKAQQADISDLSQKFRDEFPYLGVTGRGGSEIAYLDAGATAQKPQCVIDAISDFYARKNGAINRGTHLLGDTATEMYEAARANVADFFNVDPDQIIWTSGATDSLNQIAAACVIASVGKTADPNSPFYIPESANIVVTRAEHHANLLPWQYLSQVTGAQLRWIDLQPDGELDPATYDVIDENTRLVAFTHMSNVTGSVSDVAAIAGRAKAVGAICVLDTCQSVAHMPVDFSQLADLGVDFCVASGHKMYGPTGIGCLWGRKGLVEQLPPVRRGGSMILDVAMDEAEFLPVPARMEAGTQPVAQIVGWAAALDFLRKVGMDNIAAHEEYLGDRLVTGLKQLPGIKLLGSEEGKDHHGVVAFAVTGIHPHDVGQVLDSVDVAARVGHHCAIPLHRHFGIPSSTRATLSVTTTADEVDRFLAGVKLAEEFFGIEGEKCQD